MIPESHSLQALFTELIHHHFDRDIGLRDSEVQDYIVNVLTEFCEVEQMLKMRNANQRPLDDVGEMLLEADPIYGPAPSFDRERQVRKHIGDYTLFLSGMFPESINHYPLAPPASGELCRFHQGRQGELLHRLQVRPVRVRAAGPAVREARA